MEKNREELKRSRVNSSQGAHSAGTYPGSYNMKRLGAVLLPLAFHQAFLTIRRYPFILLGKEIRCESKNIHPKNTRQWPSQVLSLWPQGHRTPTFLISRALSRSMGYEGEATTSRHWDKSLGHRLLCRTTRSQRQSIEELRPSADED